MTKKQVDHEIAKIAETEVRISLGIQQQTTNVLQQQGMRQENAYNEATFNNRVNIVKATLYNLVSDTYSIPKSLGAGLFNKHVNKEFGLDN